MLKSVSVLLCAGVVLAAGTAFAEAPTNLPVAVGVRDQAFARYLWPLFRRVDLPQRQAFARFRLWLCRAARKPSIFRKIPIHRHWA